jgi:uncharacterized membrane protein (GlpM family)
MPHCLLQPINSKTEITGVAIGVHLNKTTKATKIFMNARKHSQVGGPDDNFSGGSGGMNIKNIIIYFITGGVVTTLIVVLEESGLRIWSGLATLMPVFTLISYFFIGQSRGGTALGQHAWFVLIGTLVAWVPYMATVALLSPHMPSNRAIAIGLGVFLFLAIIYLLVVSEFNLFQ